MTTMTCDEIRDLAPVYVLGALEREVERDVAEHLRSCSDAHDEMEELGSVVPYLDETVPLVEPPARLRDRIMAAAAEDLAARQGRPVVASVTAPLRIESKPRAEEAAPPAAPARTIAAVGSRNGDAPPATGSDERAGQIVSLDAARSRRRDLRTWALGVAAVLAIVALGAFNVVTQQELSTARSYQARLAAALAQAGQPGSQVAVLASTGGPGAGPGGIAVMPASGNGTLVVTGLAPTTGSQVYEAWAIVEGQPPAPVAGFTVGADGIGYFDKMPNATGETLTVAITLEPRPNPTAPSAAPIAAGVAVPPSTTG